MLVPHLEKKFYFINSPMLYYRAVENYLNFKKLLPNNIQQPLEHSDVWHFIMSMQVKINKKITTWFENANSVNLEEKNPMHPRLGVTISNSEYQNSQIIKNEIENCFIGMFCLEMPKTANERDGAIAFYDENDNETQIIKPNTGDLIIIPTNQRFQPLTCMTKRYRVLILFDYYLDPNW